jgi:D-arabinose 1-dehydrogenase-like Zn-dependent alcohol dehydrogenase
VVKLSATECTDNLSYYQEPNADLIYRTASPKISFTMREVMKNQQLIGMSYLGANYSTLIWFLGSMMGSHQDLMDATKFLEKHRIVPVVSHVLDGLESAEEGFEIMNRGDQFGKIVIKMNAEKVHKSKL